MKEKKRREEKTKKKAPMIFRPLNEKDFHFEISYGKYLNQIFSSFFEEKVKRKKKGDKRKRKQKTMATTTMTARAVHSCPSSPPSSISSRLCRSRALAVQNRQRRASSSPRTLLVHALSSSSSPPVEDHGDAVEVDVDELKLLKEEKLERAGKYRAKVAGTETPEWTYARVVERRDLLPKLREVVLEVETSRELVSLRNSYCAVGKVAQVKVKGGDPVILTPSCTPFPPEEQHEALLRLRGDLRAGQTKLPEDPVTVKRKLSVLVTPEDGEVFDTQAEDEGIDEGNLSVEVGPFLGNGINLRGAIQSVYNYPTVILCAEGKGIGTAKAMIEAGMSRGSLDLCYREDVRLYYKVPNDDSVCYGNLFENWEKEFGVKTIVHTSSFLDAFDDDDTLEYEPDLTAVISLGDEEAEQSAQEMCEEAEIKLHIKSSVEQQAMLYADTGRVV